MHKNCYDNNNVKAGVTRIKALISSWNVVRNLNDFEIFIYKALRHAATSSVTQTINLLLFIIVLNVGRTLCTGWLKSIKHFKLLNKNLSRTLLNLKNKRERESNHLLNISRNFLQVKLSFEEESFLKSLKFFLNKNSPIARL